jgi:hypothetical protein
MCVRVLARCTADRRCVGNVSHFPESPFAIYVADDLEGAAWPSRSRGNAIGERWKIPLSRSSDLSGRVNGSFSLIRRCGRHATSAVAGAARNLVSNSLAGIGRPKK